jgi:hypothetical protein
MKCANVDQRPHAKEAKWVTDKILSLHVRRACHRVRSGQIGR